MKIAGLKNDGAWFRMNKFIHHLSTGQKTNLKAVIKINEHKAALFADLVALGTACGTSFTEKAADVDTWLERFIELGIPRQIWNGHLTFTTYTGTYISGSSGPKKYTADYQVNIHKFAKHLRRQMMHFKVGLRQLNDLSDTGGPDEDNPGGNPDSLPDS